MLTLLIIEVVILLPAAILFYVILIGFKTQEGKRELIVGSLEPQIVMI